MLNRTEWRCASAAAVAGNQNNIGMGFRNARCNRANADLGEQLHGNTRLRVRVLQVVNQLREVFDRINVMMRWRRNQANTRDRMP